VRTLADIGLVHDHSVVQKLLADARSEIGGLDVVRPHFLSFAIVDCEFGHGRDLLSYWSLKRPVRCNSLLLHHIGCADDDVAAVRAGDRAEHEQQVVFRVDLHKFLVPHGLVNIA
jgi:hypothetical protein